MYRLKKFIIRKIDTCIRINNYIQGYEIKRDKEYAFISSYHNNKEINHYIIKSDSLLCILRMDVSYPKEVDHQSI